MASILATESMNVCTDLDLNPLLVQIVWQIVVVSSWKPSATTIANFLTNIYSEIRQVGEWSSKHLVNPDNQCFSFVKRTKPSPAVGAQSPEPSSALRPTAGQRTL